ncbi:MAG: site-2 protease family protein [Oligoflexia bacterium]|nr:site-2 protease family protein [Oligoflexia bacterium]
MHSAGFNIESFIYNLALGLPGLLIGVVLHEVAHGYMALRFGDPTAKYAGRLNFNPIAHLDIFGGVVMPLLGALLGGVMFGWAKPVPVDTRNFPIAKFRQAIFWVSFAGPLANFILVILSGFFCVLVAKRVDSSFYFYEPFVKILRHSVDINMIIAVFNLIPFPPLDGSKMVASFLSYEAQRKFEDISRFGIIFLMLIMFTGILGYIFGPALFLSQKMLELFFSVL